MKKNSAFFITLVLFCIWGANPAAASGNRVYILTVDDAIGPITAEFIKSGIQTAEKNNAACIIIKLDTPGGLAESMRTIIKAMLASRIPVVVYVAPPGAHAASAGTFVTLAAHVAVMAPGTTIGAASPVSNEGTDLGKTMQKKGIAGIDELRNLCIESDVKLVACQMTVDLFEHDKHDFIPEIEEWVGAASFLPRALKADINLFV